jgi:outer membrane lipoprotein-sorting protein
MLIKPFRALPSGFNSICAGLSVFLLAASTAVAQDAKEIIEKMDQQMRGDYSVQTMTMRIVRPTWERSVSMKSWSRGQDYAMILITAPAKERGQVFLKRDKEMWNWVPSINRMIKIPPSMMSQSWLGSDFTNDDLLREASVVNDYHHKIVGEETVNGHKAWKIELLPKEDAAVVWGKVNLWVSKEHHIELKAEFFDEDENLKNTMTLSDIKQMGGRTLPTHWEMIPADEEGKKTIIEMESADFQEEIPESFFSQQNMKRLRP